ncbi:MAG: hypothetical protein GY906_24050 [bacterium]|nr:hypothetical protein [bacterium]
MNPTIRIAQNEDGEAVRRLVQEGPDAFAPEGVELDWSEIYPFWVVAEDEEKIVGTVQLCMALPVGRVEMLSVDPDLSDRDRAKVVKGLTDYAITYMRRSGVQLFTSAVAFGNNRFKRAFKKRHGQIVEQANVFLMRTF